MDSGPRFFKPALALIFSVLSIDTPTKSGYNHFHRNTNALMSPAVCDRTTKIMRQPMEVLECGKGHCGTSRGDAALANPCGDAGIEASPMAPAPAGRNVLSLLSTRETEVLALLVRGYLMKEIADELGVGFVTVRCYVSRIYKKMRVRSRAQAAARCFHASVRFQDPRAGIWPGIMESDTAQPAD